ncbi:FliM/FliN family flagellar motor switch protein [Endozoicomonadaceae bacterium StTr2]
MATEYQSSADSSSESSTSSEYAKDDVKPFNLLASNRLYRIGPALDAFGASCIILVEDRLSQYLSSDVSAEHTLQINEREIVSALDPHETTRLGFSISGTSRLLGTISLDNTLARGLLDIACGGEGEMYPDGGPLTVAEHAMAVRLARWCVESFDSNLKRTTHDSSTSLVLNFHERGQSSTIKLPDTQERATIDIRITTGNVDGLMSVAMPADFIFERWHLMDNSQHHPVSREHLKRALRSVPIPIRATLTRRQIALREVLTLTPGTMLPLSRPDIADVHTRDCSLFQAQVINHDDNRAIRVMSGNSASSPEPAA